MDNKIRKPISVYGYNTQTKSQTFSFTSGAETYHEMTFENLGEVWGISAIKRTSGVSQISCILPEGGINVDGLIISGNTVSFRYYNRGATGNAVIEMTAIGH